MHLQPHKKLPRPRRLKRSEWLLHGVPQELLSLTSNHNAAEPSKHDKPNLGAAPRTRDTCTKGK